MKQILKKFLYVLLVVSLVLSSVPTAVFALPVALEKQPALRTQTVMIPDPMDRDQLIRVVDTAMVPCDFAPYGEGEYLTDIEAAAAILREAMKNRESSVTVLFEADASLPFSELGQVIRNAAWAHTGVPTEGDYIDKQRGTVWTGGSYYPGNQTNKYTIEFTMEYKTTAQQEAEVDAAVEQLLDSLITAGMTDYEKICAVYDWMCANITYDDANLNDETYKLKYTAYAALINRTAVCQGYAVLFYRLMLELGIDCRVVSGIGNGGRHAWNIVKLDGKYYNVDATWDATWHQAGLDYHYFLRSNATFGDHARDDKFETEEFNAQYPMSLTDYDPNWVCEHIYSVEITDPTCTEQGYTTYVCNVCEYTYVDHYVEAIGHNYTSEVTTAPGCETAGVRTYTCTTCSHSYTEEIAANGHQHTHVENAKDATCGTDGYTGDTVCDDCGKTIATGSVITATGDHNYTSEVTTAPGCETAGVRTYTCTTCSHSYTEEIAANGHQHTHLENAKDATCGADGYTGDTVCDDCGKTVAAGSVISATGDHNYTSEVTTAPGCETTGVRTYTCTVCSHSYTEEIAATGHAYSSVVTAPTCTEDGYTTYTCDHCGHCYTADQVAAAGHQYEQVRVEPTCTIEGSITYTCHCGHTYTEVLPKSEHSYEDGKCRHCGASEALLGDVNGDGRLNARDARALLRYLAGLAEPGEVDEQAADFNGDGRVNARDARAILRHLAGLD